MSYKVGSKALKRFALEANPYAFYQAKMNESLFKGEDEQAQFSFVKKHFDQYHVLPSVETLVGQFPDLKEIDVPEPVKFYTDQLESRYSYDLIASTMEKAHTTLKQNKTATDVALAAFKDMIGKIAAQKYRTRILDVFVEAPDLLLTNYHGQVFGNVNPMLFGWDYLDSQGGGVPGDVISFVGRPATGKTYFMLYTALHDVTKTGDRDLFVSMEMNTLAVCKRIGAMYTHTPVKQLQHGQFSTYTFENLFIPGLEKMASEKGKLYVVDGNLATNVDEIYNLAAVLGCRKIWIDGGYLVRNPNAKLDRYTRVAENAEQMKKRSGDEGLVTAVSWQFSRDAVKKKNMGAGQNKVKPALEDIGYSDVIGQISSVVIGLLQEESVETIVKRDLDLLKGRDGQVGKWSIRWDFDKMDFTQYVEDAKKAQQEELEFV